jgi:hypothetical protein
VASKSHVGRYCFAALTAILQSEKLILPRSGEALTLGVSPRGFLKCQRGGDLRAAPTVIRHGLVELLGAASWPMDSRLLPHSFLLLPCERAKALLVVKIGIPAILEFHRPGAVDFKEGLDGFPVIS